MTAPQAHAGADWEAVIGLEVHCQLATRAKLFCGCPNAFGAPPNANTCAVCTGQPGTLPVLNRHAHRLAVRAALALGCTVPRISRFDRKNYFYCDLPKGFQTTQFAEPVAHGGGLTLENGRAVRLTRIHMEEDAGKAIHDRGPHTLVDLNRAGVPLIEIVTEADFRASDEAKEFLHRLRELVRYAGVGDGDMEKGNLRCDVNVSVRPPGSPLRTKVELKNLNSIGNVGDAIEHEVARQIEVYEKGGTVGQETRSWDASAGSSRTMRTKENEDDYRYFPEPDLPPAIASDALVTEERDALPELPHDRRARYVRELGLSAYDAGVLTGERAVADFFEATARLSGDPKRSANWIANDVLSALGDDAVSGDTLHDLALTPERLAELIVLVAKGRVHTSGARRVLAAMLETGRGATELAQELGVESVTDRATIESWCRTALEGRADVASEVRAGRTKALGALIGPVMKASRGRADPELVREVLLELIGTA